MVLCGTAIEQQRVSRDRRPLVASLVLNTEILIKGFNYFGDKTTYFPI